VGRIEPHDERDLVLDGINAVHIDVHGDDFRALSKELPRGGTSKCTQSDDGVLHNSIPGFLSFSPRLHPLQEIRNPHHDLAIQTQKTPAQSAQRGQ
jgi:hypothetical protein